MSLVKERVPQFLVGVLLGISFVIVLIISHKHSLNADMPMQPIALARQMHTPHSLSQVKPMEEQVLTAGEEIIVELDLMPGWELNPEGPSWLSLLQESTGEILKEYSVKDLQKRRLVYPRMLEDMKYRLQGTFYFCRESQEAYCAFESRDIPITAVAGGRGRDLVIPVGK